jgi:hypothetical protein
VKLQSRSECSSFAVSPSLVRRARSAVGTCPGFTGFPQKTRPIVVKATESILSSSSALLQRVAQFDLAGAAAALRLLSWTFRPFSTCKRPRFGCASDQARTIPPPGFGYPRGGFHPRTPGRPFFVSAALMGFTLRSVLLARGCRRVSAPIGPTCRFRCPVFPSAEAKGRPGQPRLLGFNPRKSPSRSAKRLSRASPDAPLGFSLSRPPEQQPSEEGQTSGDLSRAWPEPPCDGSQRAPQSIDRSLSGRSR